MVGRILALDVGERRIGVAVSDLTATVARPLHTIERASRVEDFATINAVVDEQEARLVVVGLPLTLRGEIGPQAQWIERYAEALAETLSVPIEMWDERYSTLDAEEILQRGGRKRRRGQDDIDAIAAAVILQGYLDSQTEI
jgi:putative Holliday junction resolvase